MSIHDRIKAVSDEFTSLPQKMNEKSTVEWLRSADGVFRQALALGKELVEQVDRRRGVGFVYFLAEGLLKSAAADKEGSGSHNVSALCTIRPGYTATKEEVQSSELLLSVLDNKGVIRAKFSQEFWVGLQRAEPLNVFEYRCCGRCFRPQSRSFCGGCKMAFYCSAKCQTQDWSAHKPQCQKISKKDSSTADPSDKTSTEKGSAETEKK